MRYLDEKECYILYYGMTATAVTCDGSGSSVVGVVIRLRPGRTKYHISICGRGQFFFLWDVETDFDLQGVTYLLVTRDSAAMTYAKQCVHV